MRKLITAALVAASQLFASLAIADNGQTNSREKSVWTNSGPKMGLYLPSELIPSLGHNKNNTNSSPPKVLPPLGLQNGRYILLNAPTMCGQQLVCVRDGKIAFRAHSWQLPLGEYQCLEQNLVPKLSGFSITGGKEEQKWGISLLRSDQKDDWPNGLCLDGWDLSEGECLYKACSDSTLPCPHPPLKLRISGDGYLRWTPAFLLPGRYMYIGDGRTGDVKEMLSIRKIGERLYEITKSGRSMTLELDEQGQTKWQGGFSLAL